MEHKEQDALEKLGFKHYPNRENRHVATYERPGLTIWVQEAGFSFSTLYPVPSMVIVALAEIIKSLKENEK